MSKQKSSNGLASNLEKRFSQFELSTGSALTQSGVECDECPDLTEEDVGSFPSHHDPRVSAIFGGHGFSVTKSL